MKFKYLLYLLPFFLLAACEPKINEFTPSGGNADFSRYVAVGDFWTGGFADGSQYKSAQENSFPNMLAGQFKTVGGGDFKQPLMIDEYGFGLSTGTPEPKLVLGYHQDCKGAIGLMPAFADVDVNPGNFVSIATDGPFNNLGMPGLKSIYIGVAGFATLNPYYGRFATTPLTKVIEEIPPVNATFFTLWLGNFDILYFAMLGGVGDQITPTTQFTASLSATLDVLMANGAKGAVANIPDLLDAAYFHTIPYNALPIPDQATADLLNAGYAPLNQMIKAAGSTDTIHFSIGANPLVIQAQDAQHPWGMRQVRSNELVLLSLPQDSLKCAGWGSMKPVPGNFILDEAEIALVEQAVSDYNTALGNLLTGKEIALVDMHSTMKDVSAGLMFDGVPINGTFVQGNFYSLDGLNPTPRGSAVVANAFITAINKQYGASLPLVIVSDYDGVVFP